MKAFQALLVAMFSVLATYTGVVIAGHGWDLMSVFFGDMGRLSWPGQFNLDFMFMLTLSATWVGWRHRFSPGGLGLALLAFFGGASFLSIYLLVVSLQAKGSTREILLGRGRALDAA